MNTHAKTRGILFANGSVTNRELSGLDIDGFDRIIAADGGSRSALEFGFEPDTVVGDLDSITAEVRIRLQHTRWEHRPSQEQCDLEKSLTLCREENISDLVVVGIAGKRLDHTLGNLSVLARYDRAFHMRILTPDAELFLVRDRLTVPETKGRTVSLVPLGDVTDVTTEGLRYPLKGEPLVMGVREGISNVVTGDEFSVHIGSGLLAVFLLYPEAVR